MQLLARKYGLFKSITIKASRRTLAGSSQLVKSYSTHDKRRGWPFTAGLPSFKIHRDAFAPRLLCAVTCEQKRVYHQDGDGIGTFQAETSDELEDRERCPHDELPNADESDSATKLEGTVSSAFDWGNEKEADDSWPAAAEESDGITAPTTWYNPNQLPTADGLDRSTEQGATAAFAIDEGNVEEADDSWEADTVKSHDSWQAVVDKANESWPLAAEEPDDSWPAVAEKQDGIAAHTTWHNPNQYAKRTRSRRTLPPTRSRNETYKRRLLIDRKQFPRMLARKSSPRDISWMLRPSPSLHLEKALAVANDRSVLPRPRSRSMHDLSYRSARTLRILNINGYEPVESDESISLQSITAKYILFFLKQRGFSELHSDLDSGLDNSKDNSRGNIEDKIEDNSLDSNEESSLSSNEKRNLESSEDSSQDSRGLFLSSAEDEFLRDAGYTRHEAQEWAKILLERDIGVASRWLESARDKASNGSSTDKSAPWFLMNFLLRRPKIDAQALRRLLRYTWRTLIAHDHRRKVEDTYLDATYLIKIMTVSIRLGRHAKDVWPEALPNITKLFSTFLLDVPADYCAKVNMPMKSRLLRDLTFMCNRMLSQLSLSGAEYPLLSAVHQQRAQFDLIRKMMLYEPPLSINREGHRALTRVLLRLPKTTQERDWTLLKSRSWPPFKVSKTRFDDSKDREYGTSTAEKSINFMQSYGYPTRNWDRLVQVFSGWDPDGSPAVQQRTYLPLVPTSSAGEPTEDMLDAAIIASTRTISEAWAAFLKSYTPDDTSRAVFIAMFKKLLTQEESAHGRPKDMIHPDNIPATPGDGIEVWPEPTSPLETLYLPREPPTVEGLFEDLLSTKIPIFGQLMYMLVEKAPSLEFGLKVWSLGKFLKVDIHERATWSTDHLVLLAREGRDCIENLPELPAPMIAALVGLVLNQSLQHRVRGLAFISRESLRVGCWSIYSEHPVAYAFRLLSFYKPTSTPTWNRLLLALTTRSTLYNVFTFSPKTCLQLVAWVMSENVIYAMEAAGAIPDLVSFEHICKIAQEAAINVNMHDLERRAGLTEDDREQGVLEEPVIEARLFMSEGSNTLRRHFARLVGLDKDRMTQLDLPADIVALPKHLAIPKPAVLHNYVRALGLLGDHEGIYSLVQWMTEASPELQIMQGTHLNGPQHMRRLIVAIRVWLECPSRDFRVAEGQFELQPASQELVHLVRAEVEQVEQWDGWPSDEQIDDYCTRHENYDM